MSSKPKPLEKILEEAIAAKKIIKVLYNGGSQPGAVRRVAPVQIDGNKIIAHCLSSKKQNEIFELDKLHYAGNVRESYNTDLDLPEGDCCICGKKFRKREAYMTYCKDCYIEKMRAEES